MVGALGQHPLYLAGARGQGGNGQGQELIPAGRGPRIFAQDVGTEGNAQDSEPVVPDQARARDCRAPGAGQTAATRTRGKRSPGREPEQEQEPGRAVRPSARQSSLPRC
jgi:hypothetical protein